MTTLRNSPEILSERPSRVRFLVLAWVCSLAVLSYLDRVCMSVASPYIRTDLGMDEVQMGTVFSAFALFYALFEIPGGWMGDRIGPRKVITRIVVWWSAFTILIGTVTRYGVLLITQALFGAGEAGGFPNAAKIFSRWMPRAERGLSSGMMWMCGRAGGAFVPALVVMLMTHMKWRYVFMIFGAIGMVWAVLFWLWFRDHPEEMKGVNAAEVELIQRGRIQRDQIDHASVPWGRLLRSGNLWTIMWMYFSFSYGWYFYITWMPTYLKSRGVSMSYGGMPLLFGAFGSVFGGLLTDYVVRKTGNLKNRRYIGFAGFFLGSIAMATSVTIDNPIESLVVISMASFFGDLTLASCWAVCMDVGHELSGTVSGCMNMWGNLAGFVAPTVTGILLKQFGNWNIPIIVSSVIFFMGAILWLRIDPNESVIHEQGEAA
jgi:MFS transporter, ACS family, glucarate transporter